MQNKSILSVAILKANWDFRHIDYIDNFIPLFLHVLRSNKYNEIKIDKFKMDFENEFGLCVPYHPIEAVLIRLKNLEKKGLIYKKNQNFYFDSTKDSKNNFEEIRDSQQRELTKLNRALIDFCKKVYSYELDDATAEKGLISFFQENELGLLSATKEKSVLPNLETKKTIKYYIAKFIEDAKNAEPEIFKFLVDLAVGVALANSIVYGKDLQSFSGKIGNLNLFLDTGYIFALLGVDGTEKKAAFGELTKTMTDLGANLFVFEHTYDEVMKILNGASSWMSHGDYDIKKASRVLKYFLSSDFNASDVDMFIIQVPNIFSKHKIKSVPKPTYSKDVRYQIDEHELKRLIIESYKNDPFFDEMSKDETINKDIESIYSICKLRKGRIAYTLKDASYVFVTTNKSLARISTLVQSDDNAPFSIPPCITDILIGTLVWLQYPLKTSTLNEKKLIADAYAAIQPDASLVKRYLQEVDSLKKKDEISDNEYYILRTNRVAFNLLSERTKNDIQNFQPKTAREIMDEINEKHLADLKEDLKNKEVLNTQKSQELEIIKNNLKKEEETNLILNKKHARIIDLFANIITWISISVITPIIVFIIFINSFPDKFSLFWKTFSFVALVVLGIIGGFSLTKFKLYISSKIRNVLENLTC